MNCLEPNKRIHFFHYGHFLVGALLLLISLADLNAQKNGWAVDRSGLEQLNQGLREINSELILSSNHRVDSLEQMSGKTPANSSNFSRLRERLFKLQSSLAFLTHQENTAYLCKELELAQEQLALLDIQVEAIDPATRLEMTEVGLNTSELLIENANQLVAEFNPLISGIEHSFDDYLVKNPEFSQLKEHYEKMKVIEQESSVLRGDPANYQNKEMVQGKIQERTGGSLEDIQNLLTERILASSQELSELKGKYSSLKNSQSIGEPTDHQLLSFADKIKVDYDMSVHHDTSIKVDFMGSIAYQSFPKLITGTGLIFRSDFGANISHLDFHALGWGYRVYTDYIIWKSLFLEGSVERFKSNAQVENNSGIWSQALLVGIGTEYRISNKVSGQIKLLNNSIVKNNNHLSDRWIVRIGLRVNH